MAMLPLPAELAVDASRQGVLSLCPMALEALLGLATDHAIIGLSVSASGALVVRIAGADMPELGLSPAPVTLLCHRVRDEAGDRVELAWAHHPDKRWSLGLRNCANPQTELAAATRALLDGLGHRLRPEILFELEERAEAALKAVS